MEKTTRRWMSLCCLLLLLGTATLPAQIFLNYTVNQPSPLSADAGSDQLICPGDLPTIGGNPAASGGYSGYAYQWTPGGMVNNALAPNPIATVTQNTTFFLTVTDSMGCTSIDTMQIVVDTCIGILPGNGVQAFDVFPNPNEGRFTVKVDFAEEVEHVSMTVIDVNGRTVYEKQFSVAVRNVNEQIRLEGMSRGAYFVRIEADNLQLSRKMILR